MLARMERWLLDRGYRRSMENADRSDTSPVTRRREESNSLREELDALRHRFLFWMAQLVGGAMGMVHGKMLVEIDRVEDGDKLHPYQVSVSVTGLGLRGAGIMGTHPQEERLVIFASGTLEILLVDLVGVGLPREWWSK